MTVYRRNPNAFSPRVREVLEIIDIKARIDELEARVKILEDAKKVADAEGPPLQVGDILYGFCEGYFGRDSYEDKVIEFVTRDSILCRGTDYGTMYTYQGDDLDYLKKFRAKLQEDYYDGA